MKGLTIAATTLAALLSSPHPTAANSGTLWAPQGHSFYLGAWVCNNRIGVFEGRIATDRPEVIRIRQINAPRNCLGTIGRTGRVITMCVPPRLIPGPTFAVVATGIERGTATVSWDDCRCDEDPAPCPTPATVEIR